MGATHATPPEDVRLAAPGQRLSWAALACAAGYAGLFALALWLRLMDPLSSRVIATEDPLTHIVITMEMMDQGHIAASTALDYPLYPPGIHVLLGVVGALGGVSYHELARLGAPVIGAGAVLATTVLIHTRAGPAAATAGGIVAATMPEHIFRTNLLFPTNLDLLLIPALLVAGLRVLDGRPRDGVAFLLVGAVIVVSHPWIAVLLTPVILGFLVFHFLFPAVGIPRRPAYAMGVAGLTLAMSGFAYAWWRDAEFISLGGFAAHATNILPMTASRLGIPLIVLVAGLALVAAALVAAALAQEKLRRHASANRGVAVAVAAALLAVAWVVTEAFTRSLPPHVHYGNMLGGPAIMLAFAGLLAVSLWRKDVALLGLVFVAVTFPITTMDFFDNPMYWPHRTVVYMAVGVILLAAAAAGAAASGLQRLLGPAAPRGLDPRIASVVVVGALLLPVAVPVGADTYDWYRYYTDEEFAFLESSAGEVAAADNGVLLVSEWQPNLFLRALGAGDDLHWAPVLYEDFEERDRLLRWLLAQGRDVHVLLDHHTVDKYRLGEWDDPLPGVQKHVVDACCEDRVTLYRVTGVDG